MSRGLSTTLRVLTRSDNEAALSVLLPALDASNRILREGALAAILRRRSPTGIPEVIRRLELFDEREKRIILENPGRLTSTLRDAILGEDIELCRRGCRAAIWVQEYDLIPALLTAVEDATHRNGAIACETMMKLVHALYDELAVPPERSQRRDPHLTRRHVVGALELSLRRFARHQCREVVEAFLLLANRENATLKNILQTPLDPAFLCINDVLNRCEHGGIIRLLLNYLDDPRAPSAALAVVGNRSDLRFLRYLLRKIGREPAAVVAQNLKRIESIGWLRTNLGLLDELDDAAQAGAVRLAVGAGIPRAVSFGVVQYLLTRGKPGGRREAASALVEFSGADANALALAALDDADPHVQAAVLLQIRHRGIPGALSRVVEMVDSHHTVVRRAARESLAEFTFARYLGAFDMLDDEVRRSTGELVKKIDPQAMALLEQELESPVRGRRMRAVSMTRYLAAVPRFETRLVALLEDEDHLVRAEAATALAAATSEASFTALEAATIDRSTTVQEAARQALSQRAAVDQWRAVASQYNP